MTSLSIIHTDHRPDPLVSQVILLTNHPAGINPALKASLDSLYLRGGVQRFDNATVAAAAANSADRAIMLIELQTIDELVDAARLVKGLSRCFVVAVRPRWRPGEIKRAFGAGVDDIILPRNRTALQRVMERAASPGFRPVVLQRPPSEVTYTYRPTREMTIVVDRSLKVIVADIPAGFPALSSSQSIVGRRLDQFLPTSLLSRLRRAVADVASGTPTTDIAYEMPVSGRRHSFIATVAPFGADDRSIIVISDETERRDLIRELDAQLQNRRALIHEASFRVVVDSLGNWMRIPRQLQALFGVNLPPSLPQLVDEEPEVRDALRIVCGSWNDPQCPPCPRRILHIRPEHHETIGGYARIVNAVFLPYERDRGSVEVFLSGADDGSPPPGSPRLRSKGR